jgi:hypothetical protein
MVLVCLFGFVFSVFFSRLDVEWAYMLYAWEERFKLVGGSIGHIYLKAIIYRAHNVAYPDIRVHTNAMQLNLMNLKEFNDAQMKA